MSWISLVNRHKQALLRMALMSDHRLTAFTPDGDNIPHINYYFKNTLSTASLFVLNMDCNPVHTEEEQHYKQDPRRKNLFHPSILPYYPHDSHSVQNNRLKGIFAAAYSRPQNV